MKTKKYLFENRQLSRTQAKGIAESQKNLDDVMKLDMAVALGGFTPSNSQEHLFDGRTKAYKRLDYISKLIVKEFLSSETIGEALESLENVISSLKQAKESMQKELV